MLVCGSVKGTSSNDMALISLDQNGAKRWQVELDGSASQDDTAINVLAYGNQIFLIGKSVDNSSSSGVVQKHISVYSYASNGNLQWFKKFNGKGFGAKPNQAKLDADGNLYIVGSAFNPNGKTDIYSISVDSTGKERWSYYYDGLNNHSDGGNTIAVDSSKNVFIGGYEYLDSINSMYVIIKLSQTDSINASSCHLSSFIESISSCDTNNVRALELGYFGSNGSQLDVFQNGLKMNGQALTCGSAPKKIFFNVQGNSSYNYKFLDVADPTCFSILNVNTACKNSTPCGITGRIINYTPCDQNDKVIVTAGFKGNRQSQLRVYNDSISLSPFSRYYSNREDSISFEIAGDGLVHELLFIEAMNTTCSASVSYRAPKCVPPTGIGSIKGGESKIFPNPASTVLNIKLKGTSDTGALIEIYDSRGKNIHFKQIESNEQIDISGLYPGLYFVKIVQSDHQYTHKFIKL